MSDLLVEIEKAIHNVYFPHPRGHDFSILAAGAVMRILDGSTTLKEPKVCKRHRYDRCVAADDCTRDNGCKMRHDGKFNYCKCGAKKP